MYFQSSMNATLTSARNCTPTPCRQPHDHVLTGLSKHNEGNDRISFACNKDQTGCSTDDFSSWSETPPLRGSVVPAKLSAVKIHVTTFLRNRTCDVYARKNFNANVVLSGGTNMFVEFLGTGRMK